MTRYLRLFFAILLFASVNASFAEVSKVPFYRYNSSYGTSDVSGTDPGDVCSRGIAITKTVNQTYAGFKQVQGYPHYSCRVSWATNGGGEGEGGTAYYQNMQCPANSTASGSSCTCNSGFEEKNGQCVKPDSCSGLAAMCSGMTGSQKSYSTYDGDAETACYQPPDDLFWDQPKFPGCNQGCMAKAGPSTGVTDSTGKTLYKGMGTLTGSKCTYGTPTQPSGPDDPPPAEKTEPVDKRCAGQTGTVNGKEVCIPASSATGVDWTGSTTNSDGTKTEGKTTTTCSNGICESTTVTTNKDANGNTTGTTTKIDTVSQSDYCAKTKNKDGMLCAAVNADPVPGKDNQSGGNPGAGSGNGDGDGCTISDCNSDAGGGPGKVGLPGAGAGEFGKLYEPKYPQGPVEVWKQSSSGIKSSGLGSLAMALMPKIADGGAAPVWIIDLNLRPLGDFGVHDISPPLWLWEVLKAITILIALVTARHLIFGG